MSQKSKEKVTVSDVSTFQIGIYILKDEKENLQVEGRQVIKDI